MSRIPDTTASRRRLGRQRSDDPSSWAALQPTTIGRSSAWPVKVSESRPVALSGLGDPAYNSIEPRGAGTDGWLSWKWRTDPWRAPRPWCGPKEIIDASKASTPTLCDSTMGRGRAAERPGAGREPGSGRDVPDARPRGNERGGCRPGPATDLKHNAAKS